MSGLFGARSQATTPRRLQAIELQRSSYGEAIPLVYGRARVAATLIWYDDFEAIKHEESVGGKGGGGGEITSYTYKAACIMALCEGPILGIDAVWADKQRKNSIADFGLTLFTGAGGQATWSHLTSHHSAQAVPYDFTAYVAGTAIDLGGSAAMPNFSFLVQSEITFGSGIEEALPSDILDDYLTHPEHGAQFPYLGDLTDWATYCQAMGLFISPVESTQRQAADFVRDLMQLTNANVVWSGGALTVVPYQDEPITGNGTTYTPDMTPVYAITDDDYLYEPGQEPVVVTRKGQSERYNRVRVEYLDEQQAYNTAIAEAWDDADIAINGERPMATITMHGIVNAPVARLVAQLILQRQLYTVNSYEFSLRADFSLLDPMDLLDLTDSTLGLVNQLVRIVSIDDDEKHRLTIVAEEVPLGAHNSPRFDWSGAQGYNANYAVDPGDVNPPLIFTAPAYLVGPAGGAELWMAVSGQGYWGGASVWASYDDVDYRLVGVINSPARHGETLTSMGAVADPDTTTTLRVELEDTRQTLTGTTTTNADELRSLVYVGGEIMSVRDAALVSAGVYDLGYFRRGLYGSAVASHASGSKFAKLDSDIFMLPFDPGLAGHTMYFKFTSFNLYGGAEQSLADVSPVTFAIPSGFAGYAGDAVPLQANGTCAFAGYSAFKPTGSNALDSGVRSVDSYLNGCALTFKVSQTTKALWCGLESDAAAFGAFDLPEYSFQFAAGGGLSVLISGVATSVGTYTAGQTFAIVYDGRVVRFLQDGALLVAAPVANKTFFFYAHMYTVGAQIDTIRFVPSSGVQVLAGNLTNASQWQVGGTGTQGNFENHYNGTNQDSQIVLGGGSYPLGPYGQAEPLWLATGTGTGANGGWNNTGDVLGVDPTRPHRAVVWFRWNGVGTPTIQFGCSTTNTKNLNGTTNSDPYFFNDVPASLGITANKWYLAVGIIHGSGYGTTDLGIAGIYDPDTGINIYNGNEFKFAAAVPSQAHRAHQTNANNGSCITYFAKPRFEEVTGSEPTIATLLSPGGALAYLDDVDTDHLAAEAAGALRTTSNTGTQTVPNDDSVTELAAITITTTGNPVSIDVEAIVNHNFGGAGGAFTWLIITMDGSNVAGMSESINFPPSSGGVLTGGKLYGVRTHTPAAGTHTYRVTAVNTTAYGGSPTMSVSHLYMKLREYKR